MAPLHPIDSRKTPSAQRTYRLRAVVLLVALLFSSFSQAQAPEATAQQPQLTEAEVIRLAKAHAPGAAIASATEELARARASTAGLLPNPALSWARETVETGPTSGRGSQDLFTASIPIDVAKPLASRSLAASEGAWMRAEASLSRNEAVLDALLVYYEVALAQKRVQVLTQAVSNLQEAARVLARREEAGSASGYESARLVIASELSRSQLAEAQGELESARVRLGGVLGLAPGSIRVQGELNLISPGSDTALARDRGKSRSAVRSAQESLRLADEAQDRADWAWLPALELGGGLKRANNFASDSGYGYVLGVSLDIPVFDRGQAQRAQSQAQRMVAMARTEALERSIDAEVRSSLVTFRAAREELVRFESQTSDQIEALLAAAQSGYREGERTIVELLDAQRVRTEVAERRLSLLGVAKRAEAKLRAATGALQ